MFSFDATILRTEKMLGANAKTTKTSRDKYSRLICLGCHNRRIRCELPSDVETPRPGELLTVKTPCYRCRRNGIPCIVRQTILGRPGPKKGPSHTEGLELAQTSVYPSRDVVSRVVIELPMQTTAHNRPAGMLSGLPSTNAFGFEREPSNAIQTSYLHDSLGNSVALLIHVPQSTERVMVIRAMDTIRREKVENEWFRHLPAHVGHTQALDLSIKAIVAACAFARHVPNLTSEFCYHALALALSAVKSTMAQENDRLSDNILASSALLAHLEGVIQGHGVPKLPHLQGLAAIMRARNASFTVTALAKEIFDFHVCDSSVMACIHGISSPFEGIAEAYYTDTDLGCGNSDRLGLKTIGGALFIRTPRLVAQVRSLRINKFCSSNSMFEVFGLLKSLQAVQDIEAEDRLLRGVEVHPSAHVPFQMFQFRCVETFEALLYYWVNRLWLMRLEISMGNLLCSEEREFGDIIEVAVPSHSTHGPDMNETMRLAKNILMCSLYASTLTLRKHCRLFAFAILQVWGIAAEFPHSIGQTLNIENGDLLQSSLLQSMNTAISERSGFIAEDMNTAAEIFTGGASGGKLAKLFSS